MSIRTVAIAAVSAVMTLVGIEAAESATTAAPPAVTCGSSWATDVYLTRDLSCPNGNGIYLEIDVTLDLRGHKLIGPGTSPYATGSGIGVTLSPAWPSRVINGTIKGWPVAVGGNEDFETVESAALADLKLVNNGVGVLANQANLTIDRTTFQGNSIGINALSWGDQGTKLAISGSTFRNTKNAAVQVDPRSTVTLSGSTFRGNGTGYTVTPGTLDGYNARLEGNTFIGNRDAVYVTAPGTSLKKNTAVRNSGWGIYAPGATDLGGNVARRNGNSPQCVGVVCSVG